MDPNHQIYKILNYKGRFIIVLYTPLDQKVINSYTDAGVAPVLRRCHAGVAPVLRRCHAGVAPVSRRYCKLY